MATNVYEGMFILDPNVHARNPTESAKLVDGLITRFGGELLVSRLWDDRKLAYPIDGHRKGTYWLTYFKLDANKLTNLTNECRIVDAILRQLILRVEPRLVDALVEHAQTGSAPEAKTVVVGAGDRRPPTAPAVAAVLAEIEELDEELNK